MKYARLMAFATRLHREIECTLWAALLTGVLFFLAVVLPGIPAAQRRAEAAEAAQFMSQCSAYCEKWGLPRGSPRHSECMQDLTRFRAEIEKTIDDDLLP